MNFYRVTENYSDTNMTFNNTLIKLVLDLIIGKLNIQFRFTELHIQFRFTELHIQFRFT